MKHLLLGILLLALLFGCKKKKEEEPYVPVKQTYTDIPGTDIYIANTDSAFLDTGLVITVKGKGFDPKYKKHYTIKAFNFNVYYSYSDYPTVPEIIYFDESTITFRFPENYFPNMDWPYSCSDTAYSFVFTKYSNDPMAELNYQKRFLAASPIKKLIRKDHYAIFKDTVQLIKPRTAVSDFFIHYYVKSACNKLSLLVDKRVVSLEGAINAYRKYTGEPYVVGIPLDSNYNIPDGYHTIKFFKNGKEIYNVGDKKGVFIKNVR